MIRTPAVAGQFYPAIKPVLQAEVERYLVKVDEKIEAVGILSPHAGYVYSGPVAGATFSSAELKDTCIIMGPNHTGEGKPFSIMTEGVWKMPLGDCEIDAGLAKAMLEDSGYLEEDFLAHRHEHSVEVQIPFLQVLKKKIRIVPMVLADADVEVYKNIGKSISKAVKERCPATIIASSDLTHYEPREIAVRKDKKVIDAVLDLDIDGLMDAIVKYNISMCGYAPVCVMLAASKELGAKKAKLIKYQTSGDVSGDYNAVVGYGGVIVY
jgi:AmmeMemoRadiSam system protein B